MTPTTMSAGTYERTRVLMAEGPIGADELNDLDSVRDHTSDDMPGA